MSRAPAKICNAPGFVLIFIYPKQKAGNPMKKFFSNLKKSYMITAIFYTLLGIPMLIWPDILARLVCYSFGGLLIVYGLVIVIGNFADKADSGFYGFSMINGLISAGIGIFFIVKYNILVGSIGFVMGLIIVIDSFVKFQKALELHRCGYCLWWLVMIFSFLTIGLGVLVIVNPFETTLGIARLAGICLIVIGISDIWTISRVSKFVKAATKDVIVIEEDTGRRA